MDGKTDTELLARLKRTLERLIDHVEDLAIERDVCEELAVAKERSTYPAVKMAKEAALVDPEIRKGVREQYPQMPKGLLHDAVDAFEEGQLLDLPIPYKPN
jgi:hypothetical protein